MGILTIRLTAAEENELKNEAKRQGVSTSHVVRERLFPVVKIDDFAAFQDDQKEAFQRLSDLLCDNLATVQLVTNICCDIVRSVKNDDEHVIPRLKELLAKCADQKKEMKGHE